MKTNVALCFVAAMLAVFAYLDWRGPQRAGKHSPVTPAGTVGEPLFSLDRPQVTAIDVRDGRGCLLVRATTGSDPSRSDLAALTDILVGTRTIRRFPPSADWRAYGLDKPRIRIEVSQNGNEHFQGLEIGDVVPTGTSVYARRDQRAEVLVVGRYLLQQLEMAVQRLQEKGSKVGRACSSEIIQQRAS